MAARHLVSNQTFSFSNSDPSSPRAPLLGAIGGALPRTRAWAPDAPICGVGPSCQELVEDPLKAVKGSQRWKVITAYGDIGFRYHEDHTVAYVAARMHAVYSALYRVLSEVRRRVPDFAPAKVLDFGAGTGSALWAMMEVCLRLWSGLIWWSHHNQCKLRAGQSLVKDIGNLPLIQSYSSLL